MYILTYIWYHMYMYKYIHISWSFNLQEVRHRFKRADPSCPKEKLIRDQRLQGFQGLSKQSHHKIDDEKNHLPCAGKSQDCREDSHLQRYLPKGITGERKETHASKRDIRHNPTYTESDIIFNIFQQGNISHSTSWLVLLQHLPPSFLQVPAPGTVKCK